MKLSSSLSPKIGLVLALVGVGVLVLPGLQPSDPLAATRIDAASRLTVHQVAMEEGAICEVPAAPQAMAAPVAPAASVPVNPVTAALALRAGATSGPAALEVVEAQAQTPSRAHRGAEGGGRGAPAAPDDPRSVPAVQRGGGRQPDRRGRPAGREPVPGDGVRPDDEHAADGRDVGAEAVYPWASDLSGAELCRLYRSRRRATSTRSTTTPNGT